MDIAILIYDRFAALWKQRTGDVPRVEIHDPMKGHRDLLSVITDQEMHDVTAYLTTLK